MKKLMVILIGLFALLQYRLWQGDGSITQIRSMQKEVAWQKENIEKLKERNVTLEAEVQDLKFHLAALEEKARTDLGMIRQKETFFQYNEKP